MNEVGTFKDRVAQGFILLILLQVYMNDQMNRRLYSVFRLITSQVQRAFQLRIPFPFGVRLLFGLFELFSNNMKRFSTMIRSIPFIRREEVLLYLKSSSHHGENECILMYFRPFSL